MQLRGDMHGEGARVGEDDVAARVTGEPPPALPSAAREHDAPVAPLLEPPAILPAPRVETWRPPAISPPLEEDHPRPRRARRVHEVRVLRALWTSVKIGVIVFITYGLVFNFSVVRGSSMSPGIHDGDRILVDHLSLMFRDVRRGDVVVLQYPLDPTLDYIKRVIGLPGDVVRIEGDEVWVNDERLAEPYVSERDSRTHLVQTVGAGCFFVLGDNRPHSSDSREFGQVPRENLVGVVNLRVWPPARAGIID